MPYDHEKAPPQLNCGQGQIFVAKIPAKEIDKMTLSKSSSSINTIEVEITATPFRLRSEKDILPRQFLYGRHLIRGFVSLTIAPGGVGKTALLVLDAIAMASGRELVK